MLHPMVQSVQLWRGQIYGWNECPIERTGQGSGPLLQQRVFYQSVQYYSVGSGPMLFVYIM